MTEFCKVTGMEEPTHELPLAVQTAEPALAVKEKVDASQARVEHVASLLQSAYARASTLQLTPEEAQKLTADFPDSAVLQGAGGDQNLLYIEHGSIRRRLASVFGPGQWTLINRRTWLDEQAGFMYADCVLIIRGCFVGEAIGAQRYTPRNARLNYSDAVEGAQSEALRRIAGKYLDCGIQVWSKTWCEGWKARHRAGAPRSNPMPVEDPKPDLAATVSQALNEAGRLCVVEDVKMKQGKSAKGPWEAWFVDVETVSGERFTAGTFSRSIGQFAESAIGARCRIVTQPGKREGTWEIVSLEPETTHE